MSNRKTRPTGAGKHRGDRLLEEMDHDPYHSKLKLTEPTVCPECRAIFTHGRWSWGEVPEEARETRCPACQRVHDRVPAAFLTLSGEFRKVHDEEILNLMRNYEEKERSEHPMKRIMDIQESDGDLTVTFTDAHLARGIGEALHHAYAGELEYEYTKGDNMLRATWRR
jgi:NMD protein affecting ribosome stability and mRNA decay